MAELSAQQRAQLETEFAKVLASGDDPALEGPQVELEGVNPKELFCKNWGTVKSVLQFLSGILPIWLRPIVATIIKLGDIAHRTLCG